jgi:Family of unknown function (DUF6459)
MTADQAQAAPALLDLDLAAMGLTPVPDVLSPIDGIPGAEASLDLGLDRAAAPRAASADQGTPWPPRQFAVLLAEALAGVRPLQQVLPWMSERGTIQLRRLLPLFCGEHRPRIVRVLTAAPNPGVIEMTIVVTAGPRTRALAVRLERPVPSGQPASRGQLARRGKSATPWLCTDIEAA